MDFPASKKQAYFKDHIFKEKGKATQSLINKAATQKANDFTYVGAVGCQGAEAERELQLLHCMVLGHAM